MLGDLTGKHAIVTGAGSGIGTGIASVMTSQGASVAIADLNEEASHKTSHQIEGDTMPLGMDVTNVQSVQRAIDQVISEWGKIDILVNNAGVASAGRRSPAGDREVDWDTTFNVNVKGVVHCCNAVTPYMKERRYGKIVSISSMSGHAPRRLGGAYAASKAAVLRYSKGLADELAPFNINVNAICPGAVWTKFQEGGARAIQQNDPSLSSVDPEQIFLDKYSSIIPLGRPQTPEDIGKMAAFLASDDTCNVTGQCVHVDGGVIIRD